MYVLNDTPAPPLWPVSWTLRTGNCCVHCRQWCTSAIWRVVGWLNSFSSIVQAAVINTTFFPIEWPQQNFNQVYRWSILSISSCRVLRWEGLGTRGGGVGGHPCAHVMWQINKTHNRNPVRQFEEGQPICFIPRGFLEVSSNLFPFHLISNNSGNPSSPFAVEICRPQLFSVGIFPVGR